jgi:glycosyltransferase involved in cell wall biosynthesis
VANAPVISVIMPVYNAERYLTEALDSILAQTFGDFELILIDDGSTDGSAEILNQYATVQDRIRLFRRPNTGLTKALNECLRLARGEFVARMDSDDICTPDRFEKQVTYMRAHPDVVLLGGAYDLVDGGGRFLRRVTQPQDDAALQQSCLDGRTPICHPLALMRREAVLKVGGYDESFLVAQDLDLWLRLGEVGKLANLPDVLLQYRQHEDSISERKQELQVRNMRIACERAWQRRGVRGEFKGEAGWRPAADRASRHQYLLRYGWWAFNSRQRRTAMVYGAKAVMTSPLDPSSWRLLTCAALKPLRAAAGPMGPTPPAAAAAAGSHP